MVWLVTPPVTGSAHSYKYRLYAGRGGETLVRYDNEAGKGDHKHLGREEREVPFSFVSMAQTLRDFLVEVETFTRTARKAPSKRFGLRSKPPGEAVEFGRGWIARTPQASLG